MIFFVLNIISIKIKYLIFHNNNNRVIEYFQDIWFILLFSFFSGDFLDLLLENHLNLNIKKVEKKLKAELFNTKIIRFFSLSAHLDRLFKIIYFSCNIKIHFYTFILKPLIKINNMFCYLEMLIAIIFELQKTTLFLSLFIFDFEISLYNNKEKSKESK